MEEVNPVPKPKLVDLIENLSIDSDLKEAVIEQINIIEDIRYGGNELDLGIFEEDPVLLDQVMTLAMDNVKRIDEKIYKRKSENILDFDSEEERDDFRSRQLTETKILMQYLDLYAFSYLYENLSLPDRKNRKYLSKYLPWVIDTSRDDVKKLISLYRKTKKSLNHNRSVYAILVGLSHHKSQEIKEFFLGELEKMLDKNHFYRSLVDTALEMLKNNDVNQDDIELLEKLITKFTDEGPRCNYINVIPDYEIREKWIISRLDKVDEWYDHQGNYYIKEYFKGLSLPAIIRVIENHPDNFMKMKGLYAIGYDSPREYDDYFYKYLSHEDPRLRNAAMASIRSEKIISELLLSDLFERKRVIQELRWRKSRRINSFMESASVFNAYCNFFVRSSTNNLPPFDALSSLDRDKYTNVKQLTYEIDLLKTSIIDLNETKDGQASDITNSLGDLISLDNRIQQIDLFLYSSVVGIVHRNNPNILREIIQGLTKTITKEWEASCLFIAILTKFAYKDIFSVYGIKHVLEEVRDISDKFFNNSRDLLDILVNSSDMNHNKQTMDRNGSTGQLLHIVEIILTYIVNTTDVPFASVISTIQTVSESEYITETEITKALTLITAIEGLFRTTENSSPVNHLLGNLQYEEYRPGTYLTEDDYLHI